MDATVIIPARDAAATLPATLAALARQDTSAAFEVVVVDDGSRDETAAVARAEGVRLVAGSGEGPAAARNRGAALASGRVLAFTDADCVPTPGWLSAVLAAARDADVIQGRVLPPPGALIGPFDRYLRIEGDRGLFETASLAIDRALFERLGGFESVLRPRRGKELGEDVWLGWRARRAGARIAFAPDALVHHAVFPRGPVGFVAERARLRFFPELARLVPELREHALYRRWFLTRRTAWFDVAALSGAVTAGAVLRRGGRGAARRLAPLGALPYALVVARDARAWGRLGPRVAVAGVAADAVGCTALILGSLRARTLLL